MFSRVILFFRPVIGITRRMLIKYAKTNCSFKCHNNFKITTRCWGFGFLCICRCLFSRTSGPVLVYTRICHMQGVYTGPTRYIGAGSASFVRSKTCRRAVTVKFVVSRCAFCKLRRDFGFYCSVNHLSGGRVTQITTQRAHQFRALARLERKSFIRKHPKKLKKFALSTMSSPFDERMNIGISYI